MKPTITAIGSATRDIFLIPNQQDIEIIDNPKNLTKKKLMSFEYGAKLEAKTLSSHIGGTAVNISIGLSRFGIKTAIKTIIGSDFAGKNIKKVLEKENVDTSLLKIQKNKETDRSLIIIDPQTRERTIFVNAKARQGFKFKTDSIISKCLYVSSIKSSWENALDKIAKTVKAKKLRLFFTPGSLQVKAGINRLKKILKQTEILFLNDDEAYEFSQIEDSLGPNTKESENLKKVIFHIAKFGPKIIVVTAGDKGVTVFHKNKIFHIKAKKIKVVDVTGAGDAFASAFLASYLRHKPLKIATQNGIQNSSSVIKKIGTTPGILYQKDLNL